jgi:hypothetical protein
MLAKMARKKLINYQPCAKIFEIECLAKCFKVLNLLGRMKILINGLPMAKNIETKKKG